MGSGPLLDYPNTSQACLFCSGRLTGKIHIRHRPSFADKSGMHTILLLAARDHAVSVAGRSISGSQTILHWRQKTRKDRLAAADINKGLCVWFALTAPIHKERILLSPNKRPAPLDIGDQRVHNSSD